MHSFDEHVLVGELDALPGWAQIAFAAAAATRQLSNYERVALKQESESIHRPREIADHLWSDLRTSAIDHAAWSTRLEEVMGMLPEESDDWDISHALADDALSSLAYAIRCLLTPNSQEATWAARRAYEAADQAAIRILDVQPGLPNTEAAIKSHEIVQRELTRQRNDLSLVCFDSVEEWKQRAFLEQLLTEQEAITLT